MALLAENPKMFARKRHLSPVLFQLCRQAGDLPPFTWFLTPLVTFEVETLDAERFSTSDDLPLKTSKGDQLLTEAYSETLTNVHGSRLSQRIRRRRQINC